MSSLNNVRASIAMAVCNGEKYLRQQIDSVLAAMSDDDELVISYDPSKDATWEIINSYAENDSRIRPLVNEKRHGVCGNFTNAVSNCRGQYIFLCDQDDVWNEDKIEFVLNQMHSTNCDLFIHNGLVVDADLDSKSDIRLHSSTDTRPLSNFIKGKYFGCCMTFRSETRSYLMPYCDGVPHDIFTTIMIGLNGSICVSDRVLMLHRLHGSNETPLRRRKLSAILMGRLRLAWAVLDRVILHA